MFRSQSWKILQAVCVLEWADIYMSYIIGNILSIQPGASEVIGGLAAVKQDVSVFYAFHAQSGEYELDPSQLGFGTSCPPSLTLCPNLSPSLHLRTHLHIQCAVKLQYQLYRLVYIIKITKVYSYWNNGFYNGLSQSRTRPRHFEDYTFACFPENKTGKLPVNMITDLKMKCLKKKKKSPGFQSYLISYLTEPPQQLFNITDSFVCLSF